MSDLDVTLNTIERRGWTVVLLEPGTKRLVSGRTWDECSTRSLPLIRHHLNKRGGIGLDVSTSGLIVLDVDRPIDKLLADVGPIPAYTSTSPSGGFHVYCTLPSTIKAQAISPFIHGRDGERYGEVIRGPRQQVVMPPSPYPGNEKRDVKPGGFYTWLVNPLDEIYTLPPWWVDWLTGAGDTTDLERDAGKGLPPDEPWVGPSAEELVTRALRQPGARHRANGVKFQCPGCLAEGHDKHRDNAIVLLDGRWGCAYAPGDKAHSRAIGQALGVISPHEAVDQALAESTVGDDDEFIKQLLKDVSS